MTATTSLRFKSRPAPPEETQLDMTLCVYQDRESWLETVRKKYGPSGDRMAKICNEMIPHDVETMDTLEAKTGRTIADVLKEAEERIGLNAF